MERRATRREEHDERPLESFFDALDHGEGLSNGVTPTEVAAIIRRDRDTSH